MIETNEQALGRWHREIGHTTGFDYLDANSHVWEIGLWHGHWVEQIAKNYNPYITAFEPISRWWSEGVDKFFSNPKITIKNFGLGSHCCRKVFGVNEDDTGEQCKSATKGVVYIVAIDDYIKSLPIENIDLMQCNCEGGEYEIFPALIESGLITRFDNLLIQFHNLEPQSAYKMQGIQAALSKTHDKGLYADWVFEYWKRK